jgi:hypothetical protein
MQKAEISVHEGHGNAPSSELRKDAPIKGECVMFRRVDAVDQHSGGFIIGIAEERVLVREIPESREREEAKEIEVELKDESCRGALDDMDQIIEVGSIDRSQIGRHTVLNTRSFYRKEANLADEKDSRHFPQLEKVFDSGQMTPMLEKIQSTCKLLDGVIQNGTAEEKLRAQAAMTAYGRALELFRQLAELRESSSKK